MTVTVQQTFNTYIANGATTLFPFGFLLLEEDDLTVSVDSVGKVNGVDFTISGIGDVNGGNATFIKAPKNGSKILLVRLLTLDRQTAYQDNGDLLAATLNRDFDRIWQVLQQLNYDSTRSLKVPFGKDVTQVIHANSLLGYDGQAELGVVPVAPIISALLRVNTASESRDALGVTTAISLAVSDHTQTNNPHPQYVGTDLVDARIEDHKKDANPHPQYVGTDLVDARIEDHKKDANPHPQYLTTTEGAAKYYEQNEIVGLAHHVEESHRTDDNAHPQYTDDAGAREIADTQIALHKASRNPHPNAIGLFTYRVYLTESGTFTVPDDVTRLRVTIAGAGGGASMLGSFGDDPPLSGRTYGGGKGGSSQFKSTIADGGGGGADSLDASPNPQLIGTTEHFAHFSNRTAHGGGRKHRWSDDPDDIDTVVVGGGGVGAPPPYSVVKRDIYATSPDHQVVRHYPGVAGSNGGLVITDLAVTPGETIPVVVGAGGHTPGAPGAPVPFFITVADPRPTVHPGSNGYIIVEY